MFRLQAAVDSLQALEHDQTVSWWKAYQKYSRGQCAVPRDATGLPASDADFYGCLRAFLDCSDGAPYRSRVRLTDATRSAILAARIDSVFVPLGSGLGLYDLMNSVRATVETATSPDMTVIVHSPRFILWEGLALIIPQTTFNLLLAGGIVMLVCTVLLASIWAGFLVVLMVALVDVQLLGYLHYVGVTLNIVSAVQITLAVGLAVDYSAHVAHSFMIATGTRRERVEHALQHVGAAVTNGGISTFLAVVCLSASHTYIFVVFFKCIAGIVTFGLFQGLMVLPVILALVGPLTAAREPDDNKTVNAGAVYENPDVEAGRHQRNMAIGNAKHQSPRRTERSTGIEMTGNHHNPLSDVSDDDQADEIIVVPAKIQLAWSTEDEDPEVEEADSKAEEAEPSRAAAQVAL